MLIEAIAKDHGPGTAGVPWPDGWLACPAIAGRRRRKQLESGEYAGIDDLPQAVGVDRSYAGRTCPPKPWRRRMLRLTSLASDIVEAILAGEEPEGISLNGLDRDMPACWEKQRRRWHRSQIK